MRTLEGKVSVNEIDCSGWYSTYGDVTNPYESLTEVLEEYEGKQVRITIEVIE